MTRARRLALLVLVGALGFGLQAVLRSPARAPERALPLREWPGAPTSRTAELLQAEGPASLPTGPVLAAREPTPPRSAPERHSSSLRRERPAARRLEGRVIFPAGTPGDEHAIVVADFQRKRNGLAGALGKQGLAQRAEVAADGAFQLAVPGDVTTVRLGLEARQLFLAGTVRVRMARQVGVVELYPALGATIRGRVREDPARLAADPGQVRLEGRSVAVQAERSFELLGVPPGEHELRYARAGLVPCHERVSLRAGEVVHVEFDLRARGSVAGTVRDELGNPLMGALVAVRAESADGPAQCDVSSDAEGTFRVDGLPGGEVTVSARLEGWLEERVKLGVLAPGRVQSGLELVLERGNVLAGTLHLPDGSRAKAAGFLVVDEKTGVRFHFASPAESLFLGLQEELQEPRIPGSALAVREDGSFELSGLSAGPFTVEARCAEEWRIEAGTSDLLPGVLLLARAEHVRAGTADLVLVLAEPEPSAR